MSELANEPAFPKSSVSSSRPFGNSGMTLRQYYAGLAMQGFCASNADVPDDGSKEEMLQRLAKHWVMIADALLAELERKA